MDYSRLTDKELTELLRAQDSVAYTELFNRYSRLLIIHANRLLGNREEASDIVQDVLLTLWQSREVFKFHSSLSGYLYTATRNRIFNHISHQHVIDRYADSVMRFIAAGEIPQDAVLIEKELAALIEKEVTLLPDKMRAAFIMRKQQEMSYEEIAAEMGITEAAAKQQVYNAVKVLRLRIGNLVRMLLLF